jgi:hypothetical protein
MRQKTPRLWCGLIYPALGEHPCAILKVFLLPCPIATLLMVMPKEATTFAEKRDLLILGQQLLLPFSSN